MIEALRQALMVDYQYAIDAQVEDEAEAKSVYKAGDMPKYFDLSLHMDLADLCWSLEKWDEARHWYHHNARVLKERRRWREENLGPEAQTDGISDWEASTFIKAGDLELGREYLRRAITYWQQQPNHELKLTEMGLHAAQAGVAELATHVSSVIVARQELPGSSDQTVNQARKLLHYEPAEVNLLLGRWDKLLSETAILKESQNFAEANPGKVFPEPLQTALAAAARGLQLLAALHTQDVKPEPGRQAAKQAFEEAMLNFYRFSGHIDCDIYFMRLNTRLADDLADGKMPNVTPFFHP